MHKPRYELSSWRFAVVSVFLLGFALRIHDLGSRSLWFDEAMEYWVASASLSSLPTTVRMALQDPPLFSLLLHVWMRVGRTEFFLRFMSLSFSLLATLGVITLARLSLGKEVAIVAGLLIAFFPPDIRFAQEVGQYALMTFAVSWNLVFLYLGLTRRSWKWWILWGVSALVGIYSYYGAAIIIVLSGIAGCMSSVAKRNSKITVRQVTVGAACGIVTLPLILDWLPTQVLRGPTTQAFQVSFNSIDTEILRFLSQSKSVALYQLLGHQPNGWPWPNIPQWSVWLPVLLILLAGAIGSKPDSRPAVWFLVCYMGYYLVGRLGAYPFGHRYSLILLPLLTVVLAAGVIRIRHFSPCIGIVALGLILLPCILAPTGADQEDLRTVTRFWLSHRHPNEVTYVYYGAVPGFRYQLSLVGADPESPPPTWYSDCWHDTQAPFCSQDGIFYGSWIRSLSPERKCVSILRTIGSRPEKLWIVFSHVLANEDKHILAVLDYEYEIERSHEATNASVHLLRKR